MRVYLWADEILPEDSTEEREFAHIDITDLTEEEVNEADKLVREIMEGREYRYFKHYCRHDENKGCDWEAI